MSSTLISNGTPAFLARLRVELHEVRSRLCSDVSGLAAQRARSWHSLRHGYSTLLRANGKAH